MKLKIFLPLALFSNISYGGHGESSEFSIRYNDDQPVHYKTETRGNKTHFYYKYNTGEEYWTDTNGKRHCQSGGCFYDESMHNFDHIVSKLNKGNPYPKITGAYDFEKDHDRFFPKFFSKIDSPFFPKLSAPNIQAKNDIPKNDILWSEDSTVFCKVNKKTYNSKDHPDFWVALSKLNKGQFKVNQFRQYDKDAVPKDASYDKYYIANLDGKSMRFKNKLHAVLNSFLKKKTLLVSQEDLFKVINKVTSSQDVTAGNVAKKIKSEMQDLINKR